MPANPARDASFIVRIWWEHGHQTGPLWRGQAVHAPSGTSRYFDRLCTLLAFIEEWTGAAEPRPPQQPPRGRRRDPKKAHQEATRSKEPDNQEVNR